MLTRRTFTREFKREAACLVLDQGYSVRDVFTQLDLQEGALMRWIWPFPQKPSHEEDEISS